jgi:hypothetical protein
LVQDREAAMERAVAEQITVQLQVPAELAALLGPRERQVLQAHLECVALQAVIQELVELLADAELRMHSPPAR